MDNPNISTGDISPFCTPYGSIYAHSYSINRHFVVRQASHKLPVHLWMCQSAITTTWQLLSQLSLSRRSETHNISTGAISMKV